MISSQWSRLERAFVDKETAKAESLKQVPWLHIPETLAVFPMAAVGSSDHLYDLLTPLLDKNAVAKPTHASGGVTFMRDVTAPADLRCLFELASTDYALSMREMQYHDLPRKVIVEAVLSGDQGATLDDYKFLCVHGEPLLCQVDHARFGAAWSRLFRVPDFEPMYEGDGLQLPDGFIFAAPDRIGAMMAAARALAAAFDFVRVDLYNGEDGIYFGELTFTPGGSLGIAPSLDGHPDSATHLVYSQVIMNALRRT